MIRRLAKVLQVCRHARLQAKLLQKLFSEINFFGGETFATKLFACLSIFGTFVIRRCIEQLVGFIEKQPFQNGRCWRIWATIKCVGEWATVLCRTN